MVQEMNSKAVDLTALNTGDADERKKSKKQPQGEMVLGVRIDELPELEAERLAKEGYFYPLTLDDSGQLRAVLPADQQMIVKQQQVQQEIRNLLLEIRDLLLEQTA